MLDALLKRLGRKILFSALGVLMFIGYWSFTGGGDVATDEVSDLPAAVFGGGGGVLAFDIELSEPGEFIANFEQWTDDDDGGPELYVRKQLDAGRHRLEVDVAPDTYGYFQADIENPNVGARLGWSITYDGRRVTEEHEVLREPLGDNYAFFVNFEFDDMSQVRSWAD